MTRLRNPLLLALSFAGFVATSQVTSAQRRLEVSIDPVFGTKPLAFDSLQLQTAGGTTVSMTRLDLILSNAALQREDGQWIGAAGQSAFISARDGRLSFPLTKVPDGSYRALRFNVGLPAEMNHSDPAGYSATHPLNPLVNGMHWGWQGGYIFAAIEGLWKREDGGLDGYSFHIANDWNLGTVEIPATIDLTSDRSLHLTLDAARVFENVAFAKDASTTHSREDDTLATRLRDNLTAAFSLHDVRALPSRQELNARGETLIAADATPYPFTFPANFPHPALPIDNPLTAEGVALGKALFTDTRLSGNQTQSCSSCHDPAHGFSDARKFSIGAFGLTGHRQSMPLSNLAWKSAFFWDGRAPTLRNQVLQPIRDHAEMAADLFQVGQRLHRDAKMEARFKAAFGDKTINPDRIARALEQYLLTLITSDSKFDRAMRGGEPLSEDEARGFQLFNTEYDPARGQHGADCFHCHGGNLFQSLAFANNGLDDEPGPGLSMVTRHPGDQGKFSVPSLRNVANTAPYMHDGRFANLEEVVAHYDHGVRRSPTLDPNLAKHPIEGLHLSEDDQRALVAFLKSLSQEPTKP